MNYDYCRTCGSKVEYLLSKPKFCSSCGVGLTNASAAAPIKPQSHSPSNLNNTAKGQRVEGNDISRDDPDGTDVYNLPSISQLQYTVDGDYGSLGGRKIQLEQIIGTNPHAQPAPEETPPQPTPAKRGKPRTTPAPAREEIAKRQFEAVKKTIEECKSSQGKVTDVGEKG